MLTCAVALSLAAQVVEAEPSVIGWLAAALPALGFLAMVKMALGRSDPVTAWPALNEPGSVPASGDHIADTHGPVPDEADVTRAVQDRNSEVRDVTGLVPAARRAAEALAAQSIRLTRTNLAAQLRTDGQALSTATAAELTRILRSEQGDVRADLTAGQAAGLTDPGELPLAATTPTPSGPSTADDASRERNTAP